MANYELKITNHPAQARHPFTNEPLFDNDNNPVPLFPNERSVRLDGRIIAYVTEERNVLFIVPLERLGVIADEAKALVEKELGPVAKTAAVPMPVEVVKTESDEDD